jgi:hemoglobin
MNDLSLYERVGGDAVVTPAVALFYRRVQGDPALSAYFAGVDIARLRAHQRAFLAAAFGGPAMFAGRPIELAHQGLGIDDEAFDVMIDHLIGALRDLGLDAGTAAEVAPELEHLREKIVDPR